MNAYRYVAGLYNFFVAWLLENDKRHNNDHHGRLINMATGKSLSEALIFASTNPQYDDRLFIELRLQYMKIPSSEHVRNMLCTQIGFFGFYIHFFDIFRIDFLCTELVIQSTI